MKHRYRWWLPSERRRAQRKELIRLLAPMPESKNVNLPEPIKPQRTTPYRSYVDDAPKTYPVLKDGEQVGTMDHEPSPFPPIPEPRRPEPDPLPPAASARRPGNDSVSALTSTEPWWPKRLVQAVVEPPSGWLATELAKQRTWFAEMELSLLSYP